MGHVMSRRRLLELGSKSVVGIEEANQALGISRSNGFNLAKAGTYPVQVLRIGNAYRVPTAPLLRYLGVDPNESDHDPRTQGSASVGGPVNSCVVKTKRGAVIRPDRHYKFRGESWSGADIIAIAQLLGVA